VDRQPRGARARGRASCRESSERIPIRRGQPARCRAGRVGTAAAHKAFVGWSALPVRQRARQLSRIHELLADEAEELARLIEREQGKPAGEALAVEVFPALDALKHLARHAEEMLREDPVESQVALLAHKDCRILYVPYGVVLVITP
jgi:acyl-CoA reductase-like NAD-dependent aldehyde dehydrogenase